jgi:hypothetical protein
MSLILQGDNEQEFSFESNKSKLKIIKDNCKVRWFGKEWERSFLAAEW